MRDLQFSDFQTWLLSAGRSASTAAVYTSYVKGIVRTCQGQPKAPAEVEDAILAFPEYRRRTARSAWASWVAYSNAYAGLETPPNPSSEATLPAFAASLLALSRHVPAHFIPELRWNRIRLLGDGTAEVRTEGDEHHWYVPVDLLKRLRAEVKPRNKMAPLVPAGEGEVGKPMSARRITRLIERAEIEEAKNAVVTPLD